MEAPDPAHERQAPQSRQSHCPVCQRRTKQMRGVTGGWDCTRCGSHI